MEKEIFEEKKIVMKNALVKKEIYCDVCKTLIRVKTYESEGNIVKNELMTDRHFKVMTGHNDWGNDSIDSIKHKDICSKECLAEVFMNYIEEDIDGSRTAYIEVEQME